MIQKNTYKEGFLTFILYPTDEGTYVSACSELCIIREGKDSELLRYQILSDAKRYLMNVSSKKLGEHLLNQSLPEKIRDEFNAYRVKKKNEDFQRWQETIDKIRKLKSTNKCVT